MCEVIIQVGVHVMVQRARLGTSLKKLIYHVPAPCRGVNPPVWDNTVCPHEIQILRFSRRFWQANMDAAWKRIMQLVLSSGWHTTRDGPFVLVNVAVHDEQCLLQVRILSDGLLQTDMPACRHGILRLALGSNEPQLFVEPVEDGEMSRPADVLVGFVAKTPCSVRMRVSHVGEWTLEVPGDGSLVPTYKAQTVLPLINMQASRIETSIIGEGSPVAVCAQLAARLRTSLAKSSNTTAPDGTRLSYDDRDGPTVILPDLGNDLVAIRAERAAEREEKRTRQIRLQLAPYRMDKYKRELVEAVWHPRRVKARLVDPDD